MKANLLIISLVALMLSSCDALTEKNESNIRVVNNIKKEDSGIKYLNGSLYEVVVYQMNGDDIVETDNIDKVESGGGFSRNIEVEDNCTRVRISFKLLPEASPLYDMDENSRQYVVQTWYVKKGKTVDIDINGETLVKGKFETSSRVAGDGDEQTMRAEDVMSRFSTMN